MLEFQGSDSQGFQTWFETSILKNGALYDDSKRPNDWYSSMAEPHPKYLNFLRDAECSGSPVDNPFDKQPRWHVTDCPAADSKWHEVVWRSDDPNTVAGSGSDFVNALSIGDRIVLMARAQVSTWGYSYVRMKSSQGSFLSLKSPGWIDTIFNIKMEIYYAFSSTYL